MPANQRPWDTLNSIVDIFVYAIPSLKQLPLFFPNGPTDVHPKESFGVPTISTAPAGVGKEGVP